MSTHASAGARLGAYVAVLLVLGGSSVTPQATAHVDARAVAVLDASLAAAGGTRWAAVRAIRYEAQVRSGDARGTAQTLEDARTGRFIDRYVLGQVRGGQGYDGARAWTSDVTGRSVSVGAADGEAAGVNEVYRRSLSYWFRDRHAATLRYAGRRSEHGERFDVIAIAPEGGRPFELWIGTRGHRIARLIEDAAGARRVTELGDWRRVRGLVFPFAARTLGPEPGLDTIVTFTRIEVDPSLPPDAFAMPADAPGPSANGAVRP